VCLHGAGHTSMSFALLALHIKKWGSLIAFDFKGHGLNQNTDDNLSLNSLIDETMQFLHYLDKMNIN
jgi:protein phosphatase methylesterase 1